MDEAITNPQTELSAPRKVNRWLESVFAPAGQVTGDIGASVGKGIASAISASPETSTAMETGFRHAGEGLPRLAAQVVATRFGPIGKAIGLGDVATQSFAATPPEASLPSKLGSTALQTAAFELAPRIGGGAGQSVGEAVGRVAGVPTGSILAKVASRGGSLAGTLTGFEAANTASSEMVGQHYDPFTIEHLASVVGTAGALEIAGMAAPRIAEKLAGERAEKGVALQTRRDTEPLEQPRMSEPKAMFEPGQTQSGFGLGTSEILNDPVRYKLGADKTGMFTSGQLAARLKNLVHPVEWEMLNDAGFGEWIRQNPRVTKEMAQQWVAENGPRVNVETYGMEGKTDPESARWHEFVHNLDTLGYMPFHRDEAGRVDQLRSTTGGSPIPVAAMQSEAVRGVVDFYNQNPVLKIQQQDSSSPRATSAYETVSPLDTHQPMPEWTTTKGRNLQRVDVTLPALERDLNTSKEYGVKWKQDNLHENLPNTLGWAMIQYVTGKKGERIALVGEVQSRWAQEARKTEEFKKKFPKEEAPADIGGRWSNPLLRDYNRLILKSALDQAVKEGATHVVMSDAETAMMTEGHDTQAKPWAIEDKNYTAKYNQERQEGFSSKEAGEKFIKEHPTWFESNAKVVYRGVEQEPGIRLNYDTILPKILQDLTGEKGERVEVGTHKNAFEQARYDDETSTITVPRSNLIFRNSDRTPKTTISGLSFPLAKFRQELSRRGGQPLFGSGKFVIDEKLRQMFVNWEESGLTAVGLNNIKDYISRERVSPKEDFLDVVTRKAGLDPRLNEPSRDPQQLFVDTEKFFRELMVAAKETPERTEQWVRQALKVTAMAGHSLGETRVLLAHGEASFFAPSRDNIPNAVIGLLARKGKNIPRTFFENLQVLTHESFHNVSAQVRGESFGKATPEQERGYREARADAEPLTNEELADHVLLMAKGMLPPGERDALNYRRQQYLDRWHYKTHDEVVEEALADMYSLVAIGASSPKSSKAYRFSEDVMTYGPDHIVGWMKGQIRDFALIFQGLKDYAKKFLGWKSETMDRLNQIHLSLKGMLRAADKSESAVEAFLAHKNLREATPWAPAGGVDYNRIYRLYEMLGAEGADPEVARSVAEYAPVVVPQEEIPGRRFGKQITILDRFKMIPQLVRDKPEMLSTNRLGRSLDGAHNEAIMQMWDAAKDPATGKRDYEGFLDLKKRGARGRAFDAITLAQNKSDKTLTKEEKQALPTYASLSAADKLIVDGKNEQRAEVSKQAGWMYVNMHRNDIGKKISHVWMSNDHTLSPDKADTLGRAVVKAYLEPDLLTLFDKDDAEVARKHEGDVLGAKNELDAYGDQKLVAKMKEIVDISRPAFLKARGTMIGEIKDGAFEMKPWWSPEARVGQWRLAWKVKDGEPQYEGYKSRADFDKRLAEVKQTAGLEYYNEINTEDKADAFRGLRPDSFSAFVEVEQKALSAAMERINQNDPEAAEFVKELQESYTMGKSAASLVTTPHLQNRKLLGGRETLNMAEGLIHYIQSVAYTTAMAEFRGKSRLVLQDPELRANPNLQKSARQYLTAMQSTGGELTLLKNLVFFNYLGFKPSQQVVEMAQQFATHVPALINQGMGMGEAYGAAISSLKDSFNAEVRGIKERHGGPKFDDPWIARGMKEAIEKRAISRGWTDEIFHLDEDLPFVNERNLFAGNGQILTKEGLIGKPLYLVLKAARNFYSLAPRLNADAAFLSSFKFFTKKNSELGLTGEKLYQKTFAEAWDLSQESMFSGGKSSRPLIFLTGKQGATVGGLMFMLQSYTYGAIAQQARYLKNAIVGSKLSPAEKTAATKAAGVAIATQVMLAGVVGLPMGSSILALIEQLDPTSEPRRRMREAFQTLGEKTNRHLNLFANDQDMGHFVSDAAMDGLLNVGPVDLSSRFQLGGLMGVDPYKGFSWDNVIGPSADMLSSWFVKAPQALATGRPGEALKQILPTSLKQISSLVTDGWQLRNQDNRLNLELTDAERALMVGGFRPKRVAQFQNLNSMALRAEKTTGLEQRMFHGQQADLVQKGELDQVRQNLLQRAQTEDGYDPREGARRVAELVQQRTTPYDPSSVGGRTSGTFAVGKLFPTAEGTESEVQRVTGKHQIVQTLGFQAPLTRNEIRVAQTIDQLRAAYPGMSRQEALAMMERMMGRDVRRQLGL